MTILRALEKQLIFTASGPFIFDQKKITACHLETDDEFLICFLNHKDPASESTGLQLYWMDCQGQGDELRATLGSKLCISPAHFHHIIKLQARGQDGWLPTNNPDLLIILFMKDKKGIIREIEITYWSEQDVWRADVSNDSDSFPAGTLFIAKNNAL